MIKTKKNRPIFNSLTAVVSGTQEAIEYLMPFDGTREQRNESREFVLRLIEMYGDVVDGYPAWHPLMGGEALKSTNVITDGNQPTVPCEENGYDGLEHTVCFRNAFVSCPYRASGNAKRTIKSVENLQETDIATITAERLHAPFFSTRGKPIEENLMKAVEPVIVVCNWTKSYYPPSSKRIPKRTALGLMVRNQDSKWENAQSGEPWSRMKKYMLGAPHGDVSSLFVDMHTGRAIKKLFNTMNDAGLFGEVRD